MEQLIVTQDARWLIEAGTFTEMGANQFFCSVFKTGPEHADALTARIEAAIAEVQTLSTNLVEPFTSRSGDVGYRLVRNQAGRFRATLVVLSDPPSLPRWGWS